MTALPSAKFNSTGNSLWNFILQAEEKALTSRTTSRPAKSSDPLIAIRVVGWFLKDFWDHQQLPALGSQPYSRLCLEVSSCLAKGKTVGSEYLDEDSYDALVELGHLYRNYVIRVFRSNAGPRPATPSAHPFRSSFEHHKGQILEELEKVPLTKPQVKNQALLRDNYQCVITGLYDIKSILNRPRVNETYPAQNPTNCTVTEVAYIFPESAQGDKDYVATVFALLKMFGLESRAKSLRGPNVNGLHNVLTMDKVLHSVFDELNLWLEPIAGKENSYTVEFSDMEYATLRQCLPEITFSVDPSLAQDADKRGKKFALPDPALLALRAACSRVAHMSGAAEQVDKILRDKETTSVLASDGSSHLLSEALNFLVPCVNVTA